MENNGMIMLTIGHYMVFPPLCAMLRNQRAVVYSDYSCFHHETIYNPHLGLWDEMIMVICVKTQHIKSVYKN